MIEYIKQLAELSKHRLYSLVLEEGTNFEKMSVSLPPGVENGELKLCYKNAYWLAMNNPGYIYVEGFARGIIPMAHAWCITEDGTVVDPTWSKLHIGEEYFGIPMQLSWVTKVLLSTEMYGIFPMAMDTGGRLTINGKRITFDLTDLSIWIHPSWKKALSNPV
jgi:hypothetical protein